MLEWPRSGSVAGNDLTTRRVRTRVTIERIRAMTRAATFADRATTAPAQASLSQQAHGHGGKGSGKYSQRDEKSCHRRTLEDRKPGPRSVREPLACATVTPSPRANRGRKFGLYICRSRRRAQHKSKPASGCPARPSNEARNASAEHGRAKRPFPTCGITGRISTLIYKYRVLSAE